MPTQKFVDYTQYTSLVSINDKNCSLSTVIAIFDFRNREILLWIFKIVKFYWLTGSRESRHISMQNFVKISQSLAKILFFSIFQDGGSPPS